MTSLEDLRKLYYKVTEPLYLPGDKVIRRETGDEATVVQMESWRPWISEKRASDLRAVTINIPINHPQHPGEFCNKKVFVGHTRPVGLGIQARLRRVGALLEEAIS